MGWQLWTGCSPPACIGRCFIKKWFLFCHQQTKQGTSAGWWDAVGVGEPRCVYFVIESDINFIACSILMVACLKRGWFFLEGCLWWGCSDIWLIFYGFRVFSRVIDIDENNQAALRKNYFSFQYAWNFVFTNIKTNFIAINTKRVSNYLENMISD